MKGLLGILFTIILLSCINETENKNQSLIGKEFRNYKDLNLLSGFEKVSDTSIYEKNIYSKHGILHLRKQHLDLVLFKSTTLDSAEKRIHKIIDTLAIHNLNDNEIITIGYCYTKDDYDENLIAIVGKTDGKKIERIKRVWRANTTSNKIEVADIQIVNYCFNELYRK